MLNPGQVYDSTVTVTSPTQPASATLAVSRPDGTTDTYSGPFVWAQTQDGSGWQATYAYPLDIAGLYSFTWVTISPDSAPTPDYINVRSYISMVSMTEIYQHLNKSVTSVNPVSADADELSAFMMAATEVVEDRAGICVARPFTTRTDHARMAQVGELIVPNRPLVSVQTVASVWAGGPVWDNTATPGVLGCDTEAGVIYQPSLFPFWWGPWDVTVIAGRPALKEHLINACKEQVRHLWETQRGGMPPAILQGEQEFTTTTGFTFSIPRRVLELLEPDMVPST